MFFLSDRCKNAFLNGNLEEETYIQLSPRYTHPPYTVCRLCQVLYGLKQALHTWFAKCSSTIAQFGFIANAHDLALFTHKTSSGLILFLLYIDDMIIIGDDTRGIYDLKYFSINSLR